MPSLARLAAAGVTAATLLIAVPTTAPAAAVKRTTTGKQTYAGGVVVRHERVTIGGRTSNVTTVTMPKPGRGRVLEPILPGDVVSQGTMTTTKASKALGQAGTAVAINADLFEYASGQSSGMLMIDGELYNQPQGGRPAMAIDYDGTIALSTPKGNGTVTLPNGKHVPFEVNVKRPDALVTYDRGWGRTVPAGPGISFVARIGEGSDVRYKRTKLVAVAPDFRVRKVSRGALSIPPESGRDMVFSAYGKAAAQLKGLKKGAKLKLRYQVAPLSEKARFAVGGGPILIRKGKIVYKRSSNREFSDGQLVPPDARTAVGQTKDGKVIFYVVDQGSGSAGFTVPEVAQDLKGRGAVTAMTFDSGGSTAVSIDGKLLNKPSDGYERPVGTVLLYFAGKPGFRKPIADVRIGKPTDGGVVPRISYTMKGRTPVEVTLRNPKGSRLFVEDGAKRVGTHRLKLPAQLPPGRWQVEVSAPDYGDRIVRDFTVARPVPPARVGLEVALGLVGISLRSL